MTYSSYILLCSLAVVFLLHHFESAVLPGWSVCFKREIAKETLKTPCEPSAQFRSGSQTFQLKNIHWSENFIPLYFMNDKQAFNFYKDTEPDRNHLPYSLRTQATVRGGDGHDLAITTTISELHIFIDGFLVEQTSQTIALPENRSYSVALEYAKNRKNSDALTVNAPLVWNFSSYAYRAFEYLALIVFAAALLYEALKLFLTLHIKTRIILGGLIIATSLLFIENELLQWTLLLLTLGGGYVFSRDTTVRAMLVPGIIFLGFHMARNLLTSQPFEDVFLPHAAGFLTYMSVVGFFGIYAAKKEGKRIVPWIGMLLLISAFAFTSHTHPYGQLVLFTGGDDELTHEGFAREALLATNWKDRIIAGEAYQFYYQPFYRYAVALIHAYWGESMFSIYVVQTFLLSVGFCLILYALSLVSILYAASLFSVLFSLSSILPSQSLLTVVQRPFQQGLGTPLLIICSGLALIAVLKNCAIKYMLLIGVLLGLMISIRTDYVPAAAIIFLTCVVATIKISGSKIRAVALSALVISTALFPALVVARNVYIDGSYALMPTSGLYNLTDPYGNIFKGQNIKAISTGTALIKILSTYISNLSELFRLMIEQLTREFITTLPIRQILWYGALPALAISLIFARNLRSRLFVIVLFLIPFMLLLPNLFFVQHNGIAMRGHYDVFLMAILAVGIGSMLRIKSIYEST